MVISKPVRKMFIYPSFKANFKFIWVVISTSPRTVLIHPCLGYVKTVLKLHLRSIGRFFQFPLERAARSTGKFFQFHDAYLPLDFSNLLTTVLICYSFFLILIQGWFGWLSQILLECCFFHFISVFHTLLLKSI